MNQREIMLRTLHHEDGPIPVWSMGFENIEMAQRLLGTENTPCDIHPEADYKIGASTQNNRERNLRYAQALDNAVIGVGKGGSFSFGHRGAGEFMERLIQRDEKRILSVFETGTRKEVRFLPHFYRHFDYPVHCEEEYERFVFPDPNLPGRYDGIAQEVQTYKDQGFFTYASVNGFFSGLHYFIMPYEELLIQLVENQAFVERMLKKLGEFNLTAAENLLRCGVDSITFCDDMGSGSNLLFSPRLYDRLFFPWHKQLADLCHDYGAFLHMHSHGNINRILPQIVAAGVDMLNPVDPNENMDLAALKAAYGDQITFVGGVNKFFFDWDYPRMENALRDVFTVGAKSGGYIFMDSSGGMSEDLTKEKFDAYQALSRRLRAEIAPK